MSGWAVCLSSIFLFSIILQGEGSPFPKDKFGVERGNNNDFNRFKNQLNTETRYFLRYIYNTCFPIFRILLLPRVKKKISHDIKIPCRLDNHMTRRK